MPPFPLSQLAPTRASLTAILSSATPTLTLCLRIDFAIFEVGRTEVDATMTWDAMQVPALRSWHDLAGTVIAGGDEIMEGGLCVNDWCRIDASVIRFGARQGTRFPVEIDATVDFPGFGDLDADRALKVRTHAEVSFRGLDVQGASLRPAPTSVDEAKALAARYLDLAALGEPTLSKNGRSYFFAALDG